MRKRQDQVEIRLVEALLHDVHKTHESVFNTRSLRLTLQQVRKRYQAEGLSFLTKTLPRLGKALDKALTCDTPLNCHRLAFKSQPGSELPLFCGEFFNRVLSPTGTVLPDACADSIIVLRQILYWFYKYKLPYTTEQEQKVVSGFVQAERDLVDHSSVLQAVGAAADEHTRSGLRLRKTSLDPVQVVRKARILLSRVFSNLDLTDIVPSHGPGAVATKQKLWEKFEFTNVSHRLTQKFPLDAYFYASLSHVCDRLPEMSNITDKDLPARVLLVPKDSRGPRLISCEPVDFQWIQQGIMTKLVRHIEHLELTKFNVFFTDQGPNGRGALLGSTHGGYATLDLKEASDRVSLDLVRLLFPSHICEILESARSSATELPDGSILKLQKFAPMGSALCFPIMALTIWSILTAAAPDADTRESILVYGDDVIVRTAFAVDAMNILESFGLVINRDKSCIQGFFRESCGVDAFKGINVTPVRLRAVWESSRSSDTYCAYMSYARAFYNMRYFTVYDLIVELLGDVYHQVPADDMLLTCPSLPEVPEHMRPRVVRTNKNLQKRQYLVWAPAAPVIRKTIDGWLMLLRYFTESAKPSSQSFDKNRVITGCDLAPFSVRSYTPRRTSMLVRRWR